MVLSSARRKSDERADPIVHCASFESVGVVDVDSSREGGGDPIGEGTHILQDTWCNIKADIAVLWVEPLSQTTEGV